jgi:hypothetical protein
VAVSFDEYAPFDAGAGANVTESTWRKMMMHAGKPSGVLRGYGSWLEVFGDSSGMQVKVPTGQVWIEGHWGEVSSQKTLPLTTAHATLARLDRVVARADFVNNRIELDVVAGTPHASPTLPALTQNTSIWEISLAQVAVAAATGTISAGNVTDKRTYDSAFARYRKTGTQSLTSGSETKVTFTVGVHQTGDVSPNGSLNEFTLNRSGVWMIMSNVSFGTGTNGTRRVRITNSADTIMYAVQELDAEPDDVGVNLGTCFHVTAGLIISVFGFHDQGSPINVTDQSEGTWVSFTWMHY